MLDLHHEVHWTQENAISRLFIWEEEKQNGYILASWLIISWIYIIGQLVDFILFTHSDQRGQFSVEFHSPASNRKNLISEDGYGLVQKHNYTSAELQEILLRNFSLILFYLSCGLSSDSH